MPHKRSPKKLEERIARRYACEHSVTKCRNNDPDEMRERVYTGTSDELAGHVLAKLTALEQEQNITLTRSIIPDYPQGLVISDSRGEGFFDVNLS